MSSSVEKPIDCYIAQSLFRIHLIIGMVYPGVVLLVLIIACCTWGAPSETGVLPVLESTALMENSKHEPSAGVYNSFDSKKQEDLKQTTGIPGDCSVVYLVYFIPLSIEFYTPTTEKNIEKRAHKKVSLKSCDIDTLFRMFEHAQKVATRPEELNRVRIKIVRVSDSLSLFITAEKRVFSNGVSADIDPNSIDAVIGAITACSRKEWGCVPIQP